MCNEFQNTTYTKETRSVKRNNGPEHKQISSANYEKGRAKQW